MKYIIEIDDVPINNGDNRLWKATKFRSLVFDKFGLSMLEPYESDICLDCKIPSEIKDKIPDYFYPAMCGELVAIFGPDILNRVYDEIDDEIDDDYYYDLQISTSGWSQAFGETCKKLDLIWLLNYYQKLDWYRSDIFDGEIAGEITKRVLEKEHNNSYYMHLMGGEAKHILKSNKKAESNEKERNI